MMAKIKRLWQRLLSGGAGAEAIRYLFFGVLTTLINWAVYFALTGLFRAGNDTPALLTVIQGVAWVVSVLFAFLTNKRYVFRSFARAKAARKELGLFFIARVGSFLLFDQLLFQLLIGGFGWPHGWVKVLTNGGVIVFNYVASKWGIFKKAKGG